MTTCRQRSACSKVPWSKGQDTGLSSRKYWVQVPWGSLRLFSLKVRTPASQAGNDGFESRRSYGGYRIMVVRQIVALLMGVRFPLVALWMGMPRGEVAMVQWTMLSNDRSGDQRTVNPSHRNTAGSRSPFHFGRRRTNVHWTFCALPHPFSVCVSERSMVPLC